MTPAAEELRALENAGVPFRVRKEGSARPADALEGERDIALAAADLERASAALQSAGWRRVDSRDPRHAFFLKVRDGRWAKLDAKLTPPSPWPRPPLSWRRRGPVIAVVGPDGVGKSTVIAEVAARIPLGVRVAYLGNRRGGGGRRGSRKSAARETAGALRDVARSARRLAREHWASLRGSIVLCDRHPKELLAVRPHRPRPAASIERLLVRRALPWPDAVVVLEAPAEVLHARKPEHPLERLEEWLRSYRSELGPRGAQFLDTTAPEEETVRAVSEIVWREVVRRMGR